MKVIRCSRCSRRQRNRASVEGQRWNSTWKDGRVVGHLCPDCQTPEEDSEAARNYGEYDYSTMKQAPDGRWTARKRVMD